MRQQRAGVSRASDGSANACCFGGHTPRPYFRTHIRGPEWNWEDDSPGRGLRLEPQSTRAGARGPKCW